MPLRRPWAFERGTMWAMEVHHQTSQPVAPRVAVSLGEVRPSSLQQLVTAMGQPDANIERRFDTGRRCFAASFDGRIAAYGWVSQGEECIGELERGFRMREGEAYIWDCATLPLFRRKGLYVALLRHVVAALQAEGVRRIWIGASLQNHPSIRGFASAGFQPVLTLTYLRLLGQARFLVRGDPHAQPTLVADARWSLEVSRGLGSRDTTTREAQLARIAACAEEKAL